MWVIHTPTEQSAGRGVKNGEERELKLVGSTALLDAVRRRNAEGTSQCSREVKVGSNKLDVAQAGEQQTCVLQYRVMDTWGMGRCSRTPRRWPVEEVVDNRPA